MKNGTVKWFNETLTEGQKVSFEIDESRGKPAAKDLKVS